MTTVAGATSRSRVSLAHLALALPWIALVIDAWKPIGDNSFLWHIRAGTLQRELGSVLQSDPFSFTMSGESWLTQAWLVELFYGAAEGFTGGLGFVPWMILLVGGLVFLGAGLLAYRYSKSVTAAAFVGILNVLVLISFIVPRPVLFSYLFMVVVALAWSRPSTRWTLPFVFWLWASVHASFFIGLGYIGLMLVAERDWRSLPKVVASGVATLLTAHGLGVVSFLSDFGASRDALNYLTEWRRPSLLEPVFIPFLGGLVFIVIGLLRRRIEARWLLVIIPFAVLGFTSLRSVPPAWLALIPFVSMSLSGVTIGNRAGLSRKPATVFLAVVLLLPFFLIQGAALDPEKFPVEAAGQLDGSQVFHDDIAGGYLIWSEGPERKVFIDDRAELYGERMAEFVRVRSGQEPWQPVFQRDGIGQALLRNGEALIEELEAAGWDHAYRDESYTLLRP